MSRAKRMWQRLGVLLAAGGSVALLGFLSLAHVNEQCETETENVAAEHCEYLHAHQGLFYAPALVVLVVGALSALRWSRRWERITAICLCLAVTCALGIPSAWVASAPHGGP
jgi:hypothetical protein